MLYHNVSTGPNLIRPGILCCRGITGQAGQRTREVFLRSFSGFGHGKNNK
ncbi:hypothetical protein DCCM_0646 [Desulfocucumis palustris]|uniref:Uncharacterized protein n=1 Tax=Desulfocucumis palustris TaxID=1898651 RepID=A0A2L2X8V2_9FIRM|nr:hypothetical protein DCCM_0646 [Desulfocucumis palustris]